MRNSLHAVARGLSSLFRRLLRVLVSLLATHVSHENRRRHLTLDIPATPLFKDSQGGNIIPQIPLFKVLDKYNGENWTVSWIVHDSNFVWGGCRGFCTLIACRFHLQLVEAIRPLNLQSFSPLLFPFVYRFARLPLCPATAMSLSW